MMMNESCHVSGSSFLRGSPIEWNEHLREKNTDRRTDLIFLERSNLSEIFTVTCQRKTSIVRVSGVSISKSLCHFSREILILKTQTHFGHLTQ